MTSPELAPTELSCFGLATGFAVMSLGVLALGLLGLLAPLPIGLWCVALGLLAGSEHTVILREIKAAASDPTRDTYIHAAFILIAALALSGCFAPPTASEWDSLSYHLAEPKLYVAAHRIYYIPWESHSNFAFNMEMLYSIAMLAHSVVLAKLFSYTIGVTGVAGVYFLARRIEPRIASLAAIIYATLPLVFWEAGTAYVDLAATTYAILALLALVIMARSSDRRLAWIAGIMLGGMFGIKATALVTIFLYAVGLLAHARVTGQSINKALSTATAMVSIAIVIGAPWYIKSAAYTGNPFYPFAYSILGGRYWNAANAAAYSAAQQNFGLGHRPVDLLLVPWNLTMYLLPGHEAPAGFTQPFNDYQTPTAALSPLFLICALCALAIPIQSTRTIRFLTGYSLAATVIWFYMTQQVRYLMPVLPILSVLAAWTLWKLSQRSLAGKIAAWGAVAASLLINAGILLLYAIPTWGIALHPAETSAYLDAYLPSYPAIHYINTNTPADAKVILYGEPRTFYLDRGYMLGDFGVQPEYPPYKSLGSPQALDTWLTLRGFRYILVNTAGAPLTESPGWPGMVYALTVGSGRQPVFEDGPVRIYGL